MRMARAERHDSVPVLGEDASDGAGDGTLESEVRGAGARGGLLAGERLRVQPYSAYSGAHTSSASTNGNRRRAASRRPTVDFPDPIMPTKTIALGPSADRMSAIWFWATPCRARISGISAGSSGLICSHLTAFGRLAIGDIMEGLLKRPEHGGCR